MHFVLSYDIHNSGSQRTKTENEISNIIAPYSWVRPLTTTYIIQVNGQIEWNTIFQNLSQIGNKSSMSFIMTPLMQGGRYDGILASNLWEEINKRSN